MYAKSSNCGEVKLIFFPIRKKKKDTNLYDFHVGMVAVQFIQLLQVGRKGEQGTV